MAFINIPSTAQPDTMKCIAMLAGTAVRDLIVKELNGIGNVMNIESNAHTTYDDISWGIEARNENGMVRFSSSACFAITDRS